jgi:copper chaperone NosL
MPWVIGVLIALGLGAAATGRRWMLYAWVGLFLAAAVAGLVDFYLWEYDYGHNLDPTAAIKVPGMYYQPPLIGAKKLLNFTAHSWPALGGWAAFFSLATGLVLAFVERRRTRLRKPSGGVSRSSKGKPMAVAVSLLLLLGLAACTPAPKPLSHGDDACAYCKMTLSDERYGAELVTKKGKVYVFDSIECLAAYQLEGRVTPAETHSLWVVDFQDPPNLVEVSEAFFLHSRDLHSPMGLNLTAFGPGIGQQAVEHAFYGDILDWDGVLRLVQTNGLGEAPEADSMQPTRHPMPSQ